MSDKTIGEQVLAQQEIVNTLTRSINTEFTKLCSLCRELGRHEAEQEAEPEKVRYAIDVLKDMEDRLESPRKILREQYLRLSNITESPF